MNVIICGAGRIGRGFITQLMTCNHNNITFFDAGQGLVDLLNNKKEYTIHVAGHPELDLLIGNVEAHNVTELDVLADKWKDADFLFTAVGGKNLKSVGINFAKAFRLMIKNNTVHKSNIVCCENWLIPVEDLKAGIYEELNDEEKKIFDENTGVSASVIMCSGMGAPDPSMLVNEADTWVQNFKYLPIDGDRILGEKPNWEYVEFVTEFPKLLKQKIYTNNTSVGSIAYLGVLKGLKLVSEAANDPEIEPIMDGIYSEVKTGLVGCADISEESQCAFEKRSKAKYQDRDIVDPLSRIARDPIRKLGPEDRLIGPSKLCLQAGRKPENIALAAAAALFYNDPEDETAGKLKEMREQHGVEYILQNVCMLKPEEELYSLILNSIDKLKEKGWLN